MHAAHALPRTRNAPGRSWPRLRTVGFERRATIVFRVEKDAVDIVRILYGGRDLEMALRDT